MLHEYEYVREFGEGIDCMYLEMKQAGLPELEYKTEAFMVYVTIKNKKFLEDTQDNTQDNIQIKILEYCKIARSKNEITTFLGYKNAKSVAKNYLKPLIQSGKIIMTIPDKPTSKNQKYITK